MRMFQVCVCGQPLQCNEGPTPEPKGSEILLKVLAAGVCHSDLHLADGYFDLGGGKKMSLADRGMVLPVTLGHENVGEVVAVGPDAKGVKIGAKLLADPWIGCGVCEVCKRGEENLCRAMKSAGVFSNGGYADYLIVPHPRYLFEIGDLAPARAAPLACSGITTFSALKKVPTIKSEPTVIIGAGGLGLMCLGLHQKMGGHSAIVVDIDPVKREAAKKAGAAHVVDGGAPDAVQQIMKLTKAWRRRLGGDRSGRLVGERARRLRQPDQGRQIHHRRALWRRHHGVAAADRDAGAHHPGFVSRQHPGDGRADGAGAQEGLARRAGDHAAARSGQRGAQRFARRQDRRPCRADVGLNQGVW